MNIFAIRNIKTGMLVNDYDFGFNLATKSKPRLYNTKGQARSSFANMLRYNKARMGDVLNFEIVEFSLTEVGTHEPMNPAKMNAIAGYKGMNH